MDDQEPVEPQWPVPRGAPIKVFEWLAPPIAYLILVGLHFAVQWRQTTTNPTWWSWVLASLVLASCVALAVCGYRAYRDLTERSVIHLRMAAAFAALLVGLVLSFGTGPVGTFVLAVAGFQLANLDVRIIDRVRRTLADSSWRRIVIIATATAVVALFARPLSTGVGYLPLIVVDAVLITLGPFIAGLAFGTRKRLEPERDWSN
jgi:FlaA1/EpsC-like NDP-sugar epimerase